MKIKVMMYKDWGAGHIYIKAWEPGASIRYWINFTGHSPSTAGLSLEKHPTDPSLDKDQPYDGEVEFESEKSIQELIDWHKSSNFYTKEKFSLFENNCSNAVRSAMEFLGYNMSEAYSPLWMTPMLSYLYVPSFNISTPRAVFLTAKKAVENNLRLSPETKPLPILEAR